MSYFPFFFLLDQFMLCPNESNNIIIKSKTYDEYCRFRYDSKLMANIRSSKHVSNIYLSIYSRLKNYF